MEFLIFWAVGIAIAFYIIAPKEIKITENEQAKILFPNTLFWMEVIVKTVFILSGWLTIIFELINDKERTGICRLFRRYFSIYTRKSNRDDKNRL